MTKRTTRRSKSTSAPKASQAKAAKPRSPAKRGTAAAKASVKPARRGRTAAAGAQTRTVVAPKLAAKRRDTARGSSGAQDQGSREQQTRALLALDPDESRFGQSEASFHLEDSSEGVDGLREELGEAYVENATGADDAAMEHREVTTIEELGGPFVITSARTEFADGVDASNPLSAEPAPLPMV
jgi:hypothetical protein